MKIQRNDKNKIKKTRIATSDYRYSTDYQIIVCTTILISV